MSVVDVVAAPVTAKLKMIKWGIILGVLTAAGVLGWYFWTDYKDTKAALVKANAEVVQRTAENKDLKTTIDKQGESRKIDQGTNTTIAGEIKAAEKSTAAITTNHLTKVKAIEEKYEELPKTPENAKAKADEISADRLHRLWEVFCMANPTEARCAPQAAASSASK